MKKYKNSNSRAHPIQSGPAASPLQSACQLFEEKQYEEALNAFQRILSQTPEDLEALNRTAKCLQALGRQKEAEAYFLRALAFQPQNASIHNDLGRIFLETGRTEAAETSFSNAIRFQPDRFDAHYNLAKLYTDSFRFKESEAEYRRAIEIKADFFEAHWNLSLLLLKLGRFEEGFRQYEARKEQDRYKNAQKFPFTDWQGEDLHDRSIVVCPEQGFGDQIQCVRYLPLLRALGANRITLVCSAPLKDLFSSLHGTYAILSQEDAQQAIPLHDYRTLEFSLPHYLKTTLETIPAKTPYLFADPSKTRKWKTRISGEGKKIGLVWKGSATHANDANRSLPSLQSLAPLWEIPGLNFFSLQKGSAETEAYQYGPIVPLGQDIEDFADTAAIISLLDLVICVDTSVAHLAGAMDIPCWVLLPRTDTDWRWLIDRTDSPWYPSLKLFRQTTPNEWADVVTELVKELRSLSPLTTSQNNIAAMASAPLSPDTDGARKPPPDSLLSSREDRARIAAQFIPCGAKVLDIGCGEMALERELPSGCTYIPVDLVKRDERTLICDINSGNLPDSAASQADIITLLGLVEYVADLPRFLAWLYTTGKTIVASYHLTNMTPRLDRTAQGWVNHFSSQQWLTMLVASGFSVQTMEKVSDTQMLFKLSPERIERPHPKRVAVLSCLNSGSFGDRLGFHLLQSVLPPNAIIEHHGLSPWTAPDLNGIDLLVLGIGHSLFAPHLTDQLQDALDQAPRTIGIFGTQYRSQIDLPRLNKVLGKIDTWYARSEEDIFLYGDMAQRVEHLGNWFIDAFPMTTPSVDEILNIDRGILQDLPLDRTIQQIQRHRFVASSRLHPLLCALTSAEYVQYSEQRESGTDELSGKFRSLLIDVFNRTYPEDQVWQVDRGKVMQYKQRVSHEIARLRKDLKTLLEN